MHIKSSLIGTRSVLNTDLLVQNRATFEDLNRQLGTGKRATTYGELGNDRIPAMAYRKEISQREAFSDSITRIDIRMKVVGQALERMEKIRVDAKSDIDPNTYLELGGGKTLAQQSAEVYMAELVALMNTKADDRYVFGGNDVLNKPVADYDTIINGDGVRAGLKQVVEERRQADVGLNGYGRLTTAIAADVVSLTEEAVTDFGFDLANVTSNLTNATAGITGTEPAQLDVDFTAGQPNAGETLSITLQLPDGTNEILTLEAVDGTSSRADTFQIGATVTDTANAFKAALENQLTSFAKSKLTSVSGLQASKAFFDTSNGQVAQRVADSGTANNPYDATTLTNATPADTVQWYTGQNDNTDVRGAITSKVDTTISVKYGLRANEDALRETMQTLGSIIVADFSTGTDAENKVAHEDYAQRIRLELADQSKAPSIQSVIREMSGIQATVGAAKERHTQAIGFSTSLLEDVERADPTETAAKILRLETQIEASYQTSAKLAQLSLVNYIR